MNTAVPHRRDRRPPRTGPGEKEVLTGFLDYLCESALAKVDGVLEPDLRVPRVPSGTNLLGLVEHLDHVERLVFLGERAREWPTAFHVAPDRGVQAVVRGYRFACRSPLPRYRSWSTCTRASRSPGPWLGPVPAPRSPGGACARPRVCPPSRHPPLNRGWAAPAAQGVGVRDRGRHVGRLRPVVRCYILSDFTFSSSGMEFWNCVRTSLKRRPSATDQKYHPFVAFLRNAYPAADGDI